MIWLPYDEETMTIC